MLDPEELEAASHLAKLAMTVAQTLADEIDRQARALRFPPRGRRKTLSRAAARLA
jgi:hypothetical protein